MVLVTLPSNWVSRYFKLWSSSVMVNPAPSLKPVLSTAVCFRAGTLPPYNKTSDWLNMPTLICQAVINHMSQSTIKPTKSQKRLVKTPISLISLNCTSEELLDHECQMKTQATGWHRLNGVFPGFFFSFFMLQIKHKPLCSSTLLRFIKGSFSLIWLY